MSKLQREMSLQTKNYNLCKHAFRKMRSMWERRLKNVQPRYDSVLTLNDEKERLINNLKSFNRLAKYFNLERDALSGRCAPCFI